MKKVTKKGQIGLAQIPSSVMFLGLAAVIGVIMLILLASLDATDDVVAGSLAANASQSAQEGIGEVYEQFDLIGLMIGLGVVLVILVGVFGAIAFNRR